MPFELLESKKSGLLKFKAKVYLDDRGYFFEAYQYNSMKDLGLKDNFPQENISYSVKNVLRGMHYQLNPKAQAKLVMVLKGEIMDVAIDVRRGSPDYGKCEYNILSEENKCILYVPEGFAHGFVVKSDEALVLYKANSFYSQEHEAGFIWNDPEIKINWEVKNPIVSEKDNKLPLFKEAENNFSY